MITRFCILLVALGFFPTIAMAEGGALYVSPTQTEHSIGSTFDIHVLADTGGDSINAVEAEIAYNPAALSVESISAEGSIVQLWLTPAEFSNDEGIIRFSGTLHTDYSGDSGRLVTVRFKALRNMSSPVRFVQGAMLSAYGQGSNNITSMRSGLVVVKPDEIAIPADPNSFDQPTPIKPEAPAFLEYPHTVNVGDLIVVKGTAEPNTKIAVYFSHGDEPEMRTDLMSAADGTFTFVSDSEVTIGVYRVYATAVSGEGIVSEPSRPISITAGSAGFAAAALFNVSVLQTLLPYLLLLILAGLGGGYLVHRHRLAKLRHEQQVN